MRPPSRHPISQGALALTTRASRDPTTTTTTTTSPARSTDPAERRRPRPLVQLTWVQTAHGLRMRWRVRRPEPVA